MFGGWHITTLVHDAEATWIPGRDAIVKKKPSRDRKHFWNTPERTPSQGSLASMGTERIGNMKLKVLISAGLVAGMSLISIMAFASSFVYESKAPEKAEAKPTAVAVAAPKQTVEREPIVQVTEPVAEVEAPVIEVVEPEGYVDISEEDAYLLTKIAKAEAGNQGAEGQALVMNVILNRVEDQTFPGNIRDVIYQQFDGTYQFSPVGNGSFDSAVPNEDSYKALEMIVDGWDKSLGALYFESGGKSAWHRNHLKFLFQYKDHYFYTTRS